LGADGHGHEERDQHLITNVPRQPVGRQTPFQGRPIVPVGGLDSGIRQD
jgi:hypothetical protein